MIAKPVSRIKQARYLSKWKVKRNGRLHIPASDIDSQVAVPTANACTYNRGSGQALQTRLRERT